MQSLGADAKTAVRSPRRNTRSARPRAQLGAQSWSVELTVPEALSLPIGARAIFAGGQFFCNFYKISESPDIEHYASFSPVDSEKPNFHLPECFARAVLI